MSTYPIAMTIQSYWKEKPQFVKPHMNEPLCWVMIAVEDGRFRYTIDGVKGEAGAGDVVLCPPGVDCSRHVIKPLSFHYFLFRDTETDPAAAARTTDLIRHLLGYKYTAAEKDRLYDNYRYIHKFSRVPGLDSIRWLEHYVNDIWLMCRAEAENRAMEGQIAQDKRMLEAKQLIEQHAFEDVKLQDIADQLHIHPVQLSRRFQRIFDISPSRYLTSIRMERAKLLLAQTEFTIDSIARQCGYEDGFYFSRAFTRYCQVNPSRYRTNHKLEVP